MSKQRVTSDSADGSSSGDAATRMEGATTTTTTTTTRSSTRNSNSSAASSSVNYPENCGVSMDSLSSGNPPERRVHFSDTGVVAGPMPMGSRDADVDHVLVNSSTHLGTRWNASTSILDEILSGTQHRSGPLSNSTPRCYSSSASEKAMTDTNRTFSLSGMAALPPKAPTPDPTRTPLGAAPAAPPRSSNEEELSIVESASSSRSRRNRDEDWRTGFCMNRELLLRESQQRAQDLVRRCTAAEEEATACRQALAGERASMAAAAELHRADCAILRSDRDRLEESVAELQAERAALQEALDHARSLTASHAEQVESLHRAAEEQRRAAEKRGTEVTKLRAEVAQWSVTCERSAQELVQLQSAKLSLEAQLQEAELRSTHYRTQYQLLLEQRPHHQVGQSLQHVTTDVSTASSLAETSAIAVIGDIGSAVAVSPPPPCEAAMEADDHQLTLHLRDVRAELATTKAVCERESLARQAGETELLLLQERVALLSGEKMRAVEELRMLSEEATRTAQVEGRLAASTEACEELRLQLNAVAMQWGQVQAELRALSEAICSEKVPVARAAEASQLPTSPPSPRAAAAAPSLDDAEAVSLYLLDQVRALRVAAQEQCSERANREQAHQEALLAVTEALEVSRQREAAALVDLSEASASLRVSTEAASTAKLTRLEELRCLRGDDDNSGSSAGVAVWPLARKQSELIRNALREYASTSTEVKTKALQRPPRQQQQRRGSGSNYDDSHTHTRHGGGSVYNSAAPLFTTDSGPQADSIAALASTMEETQQNLLQLLSCFRERHVGYLTLRERVKHAEATALEATEQRARLDEQLTAQSRSVRATAHRQKATTVALRATLEQERDELHKRASEAEAALELKVQECSQLKQRHQQAERTIDRTRRVAAEREEAVRALTSELSEVTVTLREARDDLVQLRSREEDHVIASGHLEVKATSLGTQVCCLHAMLEQCVRFVVMLLYRLGALTEQRRLHERDTREGQRELEAVRRLLSDTHLSPDTGDLHCPPEWHSSSSTTTTSTVAVAGDGCGSGGVTAVPVGHDVDRSGCAATRGVLEMLRRDSAAFPAVATSDQGESSRPRRRFRAAVLAAVAIMRVRWLQQMRQRAVAVARQEAVALTVLAGTADAGAAVVTVGHIDGGGRGRLGYMPGVHRTDPILTQLHQPRPRASTPLLTLLSCLSIDQYCYRLDAQVLPRLVIPSSSDLLSSMSHLLRPAAHSSDEAEGPSHPYPAIEHLLHATRLVDKAVENEVFYPLQRPRSLSRGGAGSFALASASQTLWQLLRYVDHHGRRQRAVARAQQDDMQALATQNRQLGEALQRKHDALAAIEADVAALEARLPAQAAGSAAPEPGLRKRLTDALEAIRQERQLRRAAEADVADLKTTEIALYATQQHLRNEVRSLSIELARASAYGSASSQTSLAGRRPTGAFDTVSMDHSALHVQPSPLATPVAEQWATHHKASSAGDYDSHSFTRPQHSDHHLQCHQQQQTQSSVQGWISNDGTRSGSLVDNHSYYAALLRGHLDPRHYQQQQSHTSDQSLELYEPLIVREQRERMAQKDVHM